MPDLTHSQDIYEWTEASREALNRLDRTVSLQLGRAYATLGDRAQDELNSYRARYEAFVARYGEPTGGLETRPGGRHYVFQQERVESLITQLQGDVDTYHGIGAGIIADGQEAAMRQAQVEIEAFGGAAAPATYGQSLSFAVLPEEAIHAVVGMTSNGTPLRTLMRERARTTSEAARDSLVAGVALGYGPNKIADELDKSLNQSHYKNLMLARTEVMRAHHEAQRMEILQNADLLAGWRWSSAADSDTCPLCWAQHGRVFPIQDAGYGTETQLAQHRGFDDFLTRGALQKAEKGTVDAEAMP